MVDCQRFARRTPRPPGHARPGLLQMAIDELFRGTGREGARLLAFGVYSSASREVPPAPRGIYASGRVVLARLAPLRRAYGLAAGSPLPMPSGRDVPPRMSDTGASESRARPPCPISHGHPAAHRGFSLLPRRSSSMDR